MVYKTVLKDLMVMAVAAVGAGMGPAAGGLGVVVAAAMHGRP